MKTVMQLLSLLLCFEFIIAPVQGSLLITSAIAQEEGKTCPAGQVYEASVNRCLLKQEVIDQNKNAIECGDNKECYENIAKKGSAGYSDKVEQSGLNKAANIATIAIPTIILTSVLLEKQKRKKEGAKTASYSCNPPSLLLMYGAAAALGVGELYGWINHSARLKKIKGEWDKTVMPKKDSDVDQKRVDATEAQSQAFEFLAQNEEQVGKTAKTKKGFYIAATSLFAAGAIAAGVEFFQLKAAVAKYASTGDQAAYQTMNRLSCYSEDDTKGNEKHKADKDKAAEEIKLKEQEAKDAAELKDLEAKHAAQDAADIKANPNTPENIEKQRLIDEKAKAQRALEEKKIKEIKMRQQNNKPNDNASNDDGSVSSIPSFDKYKMKQVAAYNLSTAKDADQFLNLMQEFEAIEFENYSKVKYVEEDQSIKSIEFSPIVAKMIAGVLIPSSHANGGIMAMAMPMAMPLLSGLKNLTGIIKFNNGKPITMEDMQSVERTSKSFIIKAISKPVTRIAINGVLGGWMAIQIGNMNKQQKLAQERAKKLREMKEEFVTQGGLLYCKPEDRNDTTKPKCYCYTPENKINPSRTSTETCKNALATLNKATDDVVTDKVCVSAAIAIDSNCACRATNTCLKTTAGFTTMGFSPNTFKMISANAGPANDLFNGTASAGDIADSAGINAARTQAAAAAVIAKDANAVKESKAAASAFEKGLLATTSGLSMPGSSGSSALPTSPAAAAAALDKEIKENNEEIDVTTSGPSTSTNANFDSSEEVPEFGMSGADAANQEIEIAEVMGKEVDFGSNDINKTKDTNLFEVLSNRYQRSGMKRLFEDGKPTPADAPAKSDISN